MTAINHIHVVAPPRDVFATLAVADLYADWVVGASDVRDVDAAWPAVGARFHHTQGVPHVGLKDTTEILETDPPRRLVLEVRARPLLIARVTLDLVDGPRGTVITMTESPTGGWLSHIDGRLLDRLIHARNAVSLRRLRRLCERQAAVATAR